MQVVETQALTGGSDVVYTTSQVHCCALQLLTGLDDPFWTIFFDVLGDGDGNLKLVRVWVGILSFLELLNMARAQLKVLLYKHKPST